MKRRQAGFNLVSLMVGTVISMIGILAMLTIYKNLVGVSVETLQHARQDGQVTAGLLTAERELANAGFRIESAAVGTHLMLLSGAALSGGSLSGTLQNANIPTLSATATGGATGNALVWSYKSSATATATCVGLLINASSGTISRLQGASGCTQASQWGSTTWTAAQLVAAGQATSSFSARYTACWPYGKTGDATVSAANRLQVSLIANTSTTDTSAQGTYLKNQSTVCLPNFVKAAS